MYISFYYHACECHDTSAELKDYITNVAKIAGNTPNYISICVNNNEVFWDVEGNNIPIDSITKFHPELSDKIESFIKAKNEVPNIGTFNIITAGLNMASYMALKCRYEMYGYAIVDMLRMIYPNYIIVLEPL